MAFEFKFPDIGEGLTEGEIVRWRVKEGEEIQEGQPMVEVETDKALAEIPSPRTGTVVKILALEKEVIKVGAVIVVIGDREEFAAAASAPSSRPRSVGVVGELEEAPEEPAGGEAMPVSAEPVPAGRSLAVPAVRALARELKVDLDRVKGTGPDGRVLEGDVRAAAEGKAPEEAAKSARKMKKYDLYGYIEHVPVKGVRRSIARAMVKSAFTAPHVTAMDEADITELWKLRNQARPAAEAKGAKLTLMPFIIKAVVGSLQEHPFLNATLDDENEEIVLKKYYNIGMATDTAEGLMVPVIKSAPDKSILQLAREMAELAEKARNRSIDLADLKGGTFTITNYGAIGSLWGTPIINPPEVAILGVGRMRETPMVLRDRKVAIRMMLPLSLSFDHRVIDGAEGARFLNKVIAWLQDPGRFVLGG
jgi:pyruvate dehydrogenase E2 component (dihydrolipoamide acetyltransferase)